MTKPANLSWGDRLKKYRNEHFQDHPTDCQECRQAEELAEFLSDVPNDVDPSTILAQYDEMVRLREKENSELFSQYFEADASSSGTGSPLFSAKWGGKCKECGERYRRGEEVGYAEGMPGPLCAECHRMNDTFEPYWDGNYYNY